MGGGEQASRVRVWILCDYKMISFVCARVAVCPCMLSLQSEQAVEEHCRLAGLVDQTLSGAIRKQERLRAWVLRERERERELTENGAWRQSSWAELRRSSLWRPVDGRKKRGLFSFLYMLRGRRHGEEKWRRRAPTLTNRALLNLKLLNPRFRERNYQRLRPYLVCPQKFTPYPIEYLDTCMEY